MEGGACGPAPLRCGDAVGSALDSLPQPFVIRDELLGALRIALADAGFPEPADGVALDTAEGLRSRRLHHECRAPAREACRGGAARHRGQDRGGARSGAPAPPGAGPRSPGPGSSTCTSRPRGSTTCSRAVVAAGERLRARRRAGGPRINLEFVSANPTGPLHAGGGRWVAVGDALANLLAAQGAVVHREYYLNDAGNQLDTFGASLLARVHGEEPPDDGYQGEYVADMAGPMRAELGADISLDDTRASGAIGMRSRGSGTTSGGSAWTSTRGSRSARCTSRAKSPRCSRSCGGVASCTRPTVLSGCDPPTSATSATACW